MTTITCAHCAAQTPDDSNHCDQCGRTIKICVKCGPSTEEKFCNSCGQLLVQGQAQAPKPEQPVSTPAPQVFRSADPASTAMPASPMPQDQGPRTSRPAIGAPRLRLINHSLGLDFIVESGQTVGRNHVPALGHLHDRGVSGTHARFDHSLAVGWTVTDLGSSFGTACEQSPAWNPAQFGPVAATPITLHVGWILRLGYVEFMVQQETGAPILASARVGI